VIKLKEGSKSIAERDPVVHLHNVYVLYLTSAFDWPIAHELMSRFPITMVMVPVMILLQRTPIDECTHDSNPRSTSFLIRQRTKCYWEGGENSTTKGCSKRMGITVEVDS
jgi:hypothetical protein